MIIGYGRTSTIEQVAGLEAQVRDLKAAGAEKLFRENVSSVAPRKQLETAIEFRGSWKGSPRPRRKANIAAASLRLAPKLHRSLLWLTLARPEEKRRKS